MSLRTYQGPAPIVLLENRLVAPLRPGMWVTHFDYGGMGMVVAVRLDDPQEVSVLWSVEPASFADAGFIFAPYIPLQVTESIFANVKTAFDKVAESIGHVSKKVLNTDFFGTIKVKDIK